MQNYAFIGTGDQLIAGGGASDFGIRAQGNILFSSGGNSERMRIDSFWASVDWYTD